MPTEEEKRQEQFLLLLLALARASERKINDGVRRRLVSAMRKIRRLVQQMSPTGQFRVFEWSRIKPQVLPLLEEITRTLRFYLLPEIQRLIPDVQDAAFDFVKGDEPETAELRPKTQEQIANTTTAGGTATLATLLGAAAINRYTLQMAKDLDTLVKKAIFLDESTQEISDKIIKMTTRRGQPAAQIHTGSFANQMWNRARATTAGAIWSATSTTMQEQWLGIDAKRWVWNALLDPSTCPLCRPRDSQIVATPFLFNGLPPLHPNCRCAVLPVLG